MNHAEMPDELYELYLLDALEGDERDAMRNHLREGCPHCSSKLQQAERVVAAMAGMAEPVEPPPNLREKVLSITGPVKQSPRSWFYAASLFAAACLALVVLSLWLGKRNLALEQQLAVMRTDSSKLRAALQFMSRGDTRTVQFGNDTAPSGRVFISRDGGVVFVGSQLPSLTTNQSFELWVVPAQGTPRPAGIFRADQFGNSVNIAPASVNASGAAAVAVSIEPAQGSTAPTTKPFLVVPLS